MFLYLLFSHVLLSAYIQAKEVCAGVIQTDSHLKRARLAGDALLPFLLPLV